jgi:hypothetical protein
MLITSEGPGFHASKHASLFMSFAGGGDSSRGIAIDSSLRKGPSPGAGAHKKEFNLAIRLQAIADGRDYGSRRRAPAKQFLA